MNNELHSICLPSKVPLGSCPNEGLCLDVHAEALSSSSNDVVRLLVTAHQDTLRRPAPTLLCSLLSLSTTAPRKAFGLQAATSEVRPLVIKATGQQLLPFHASRSCRCVSAQRTTMARAGPGCMQGGSRQTAHAAPTQQCSSGAGWTLHWLPAGVCHSPPSCHGTQIGVCQSRIRAAAAAVPGGSHSPS